MSSFSPSYSCRREDLFSFFLASAHIEEERLSSGTKENIHSHLATIVPHRPVSRQILEDFLSKWPIPNEPKEFDETRERSSRSNEL